MDVALIRKLLDKTPIEDLRKYLEVYNSDAEAIQGMAGSELFRYMAARPRLPFGEEYSEALKIREYNKPGSLTGFSCPVCRKKGHLMDIADVQTCYDLLNYRYNNARPTTILSSKLSLSQIQQIAGRIKERCRVNFVTVSSDLAKNWRLKGV